MTQALVQVDRQDGIAVITLNRPEKLNALSAAMRREICRVFRTLNAEPGLVAAILTGAGRAFCAGLDLQELGTGGGIADVAGREDTDISVPIRAFEPPLIGAINGAAVTGGFELALMCDVLIASSEAKFADTHARVGVMPGWGLSQLSRIVGAYRAREISLTGNFVDAQKAEAWGIVSRVVPAHELLPTALALARDMASCDPYTLRNYKRVINATLDMPRGAALVHEAEVSRLSRGNATADKIAARRAAVFDRGRDQSH
ncbi:MAG: enoyl-CoA hydratase [Gammaproteobacteria bacterium]